MCDNAQIHAIFILLAPEIKGNNEIVFENDGEAIVQFKRSEPLKSVILGYVTTVDETARGMYA